MKLSDQLSREKQEYLNQKKNQEKENKEKALKLINAIKFKALNHQALLTTNVIDNAVKREYHKYKDRNYVEMPEEILKNNIGIDLGFNVADDTKYRKYVPDFKVFDEYFKYGQFLDDWIHNHFDKEYVKYDDITQTINHEDYIEERTIRKVACSSVEGPIEYLIYLDKTYKFDFVMQYLEKQGFKIEKDSRYSLYRLYF